MVVPVVHYHFGSARRDGPTNCRVHFLSEQPASMAVVGAGAIEKLVAVDHAAHAVEVTGDVYLHWPEVVPAEFVSSGARPAPGVGGGGVVSWRPYISSARPSSTAS